MSILIQEIDIRSRKELSKWIKFPFELYQNNKFWVPPMIQDEMDFFDFRKNNFILNSHPKCFLALRDGKEVGRVACFINEAENKGLEEKKIRFGWLDFIDDFEVSKALMDKVSEYANSKGLKQIEGPMGLTNLDKAGMLIEGFDEMGTMVTWYNHEYYFNHIKKLGYEVSKEWIEMEIMAPDVLDDKLKRVVGIVKDRFKLGLANLNKKALTRRKDELFELISNSYKSLSSFVTLSEKEVEYYGNRYIKYIDMDYFACVCDENDKIVGFGVAMPSYSKAIQKAKGKLFPFGFIHFLKAKKNNDTLAFYLIGVQQKYQGKGIPSIIFEKFFYKIKERGIKKIETNPELIENTSILKLWEPYQKRIHKRRVTLSKKI